MATWLFSVFLVSIVYASGTDLLSTLSAQSSLTKFTSLISGYPDLLAAAQAGSMTVIAPNNNAFESFFASPYPAGNFSSSDQLRALLQYHILTGLHSTVSIPSTPIFIPSILTNTSYTNVTTGQVIEAVANQTATTFHSALHQVSTVLGPENDIVYLQGYIHIVDAVMIPPLNALATISAYPLQYYIAAISPLLTTDLSNVLENYTNTAFETFFLPNGKTQAEQFLNGTLKLSQSEILDITEYSTVQGLVLYSNNLTNGSTWLTKYGENITITMIGEDTYVNDAKIITPNILIANGVAHAIDRVLNASVPDARPQMNNTTAVAPLGNNATTTGNPTNPAAEQTQGLSTGSKAGIGIGVAIAILAAIATGIICLRRRHKKNSVELDSTTAVAEKRHYEVHEKDNVQVTRHELPTRSHNAVELDARTGPPELDGSSRFYELDSTTDEKESALEKSNETSVSGEKELLHVKHDYQERA